MCACVTLSRGVSGAIQLWVLVIVPWLNYISSKTAAHRTVAFQLHAMEVDVTSGGARSAMWGVGRLSSGNCCVANSCAFQHAAAA